jgi:hypothetical protein
VFRKLMRKKRVVVGLSIAVLAVAGAAIAFWTASGEGEGTGTVASSNGSLVLHGSIAPGLTPGGSEAVSYTADNTGTSALQVATISAVVSIDAEHAAEGCKAADFSVADTTENQTIPASTSDVALENSGTIEMEDSAENQDACKGATISLALSS